MPRPERGESREDFLDRCMIDPEAVRDYPDPAQRFAVCVSFWDEAATEKRATGAVAKLDEERRIVYGWAYVVKDAEGRQVVDHSGDLVVDEQNLEDVATDYVLKSREGDVMHDMDPKAVLVESFVLTPEKAEKMELVAKGAGWWVGFKVLDDDVWKRVKSGELRMFSIHGRGVRIAVEE